LSGIYPFKTWLDEGHVWRKDSPLIKGDDHEAYTKPNITEDQHRQPTSSRLQKQHQAEPTPGRTNTRQNQHKAEPTPGRTTSPQLHCSRPRGPKINTSNQPAPGCRSNTRRNQHQLHCSSGPEGPHRSQAEPTPSSTLKPWEARTDQRTTTRQRNPTTRRQNTQHSNIDLVVIDIQ